MRLLRGSMRVEVVARQRRPAVALTSLKDDFYNAFSSLQLSWSPLQMREDVIIIGGGLAGSEAAWQAANH